MANTLSIWALILGFFLLKETITRFEIASLILCSTGVVLIAFSSINENDSVPKYGSKLLGSLLVLSSAWTAAFTPILIRFMQKYSFTVVTLYFGLVSVPVFVVWIAVETLANGTAVRFFHYSGS